MKYDFKSRLSQCWPLLLEHGIEHITFPYSGSGDSGSFSDPEISPSSEKALDVLSGTRIKVLSEWQSFNQSTKKWERGEEIVERSVMEVLIEVAEDYLASCHGGWENNEGGEGNVELDCTTFTMTLNHREFIQTYQDSVASCDVAPSDLERIVLETQEVKSASE